MIAGGGGGTAAWEILGLGGHNPDTANKGGYGEKLTGMPRRRVKESSAGQRAQKMAGGDTATLAAEILRQPAADTPESLRSPFMLLLATAGAPGFLIF